MKPEELELVTALTKLPERRFIEVIYSAMRSRNADALYPEGEFEFARWCLANTTFGRFQGETDDEVTIELIGLVVPDLEHVDWEHLCQQGKCENCKAVVTSVSKIAMCPACSNRVDCT